VTSPLAGAATNRRKFLGLAGLSAVSVAGGGLLTGCGEERSGSGGTADTGKFADVLPAKGELPAGLPKPDLPGVKPMPDAYSSFPTNLVDAISEKPGTSGKEISALTPAWGPAPPGMANNAYIQAINAELGTPVNFSTHDGLTYVDKLNTLLGARDVPELLCVPQWEVDRLPRFSDATKALFEDLTPYLAGDKVKAYPMLATFPTEAWRTSVWNGRLMAIPNPTDGPFAWSFFYRKDLLDAKGLTYPKTIDELFEIGKQVTDPRKGVWAFNDITKMVAMLHKAPGSKTGWRLKPDGTPEHQLETPEYKQAIEFMAKVFKAGLVHPDVVATSGGDAKDLMESGKILFLQDGPGTWQGMQAEQQKITPTFNIQPVPIFSATGGDPLVWGDWEPISWLFIRKGLAKERVEELLRIINWCSAPFGTKEWVQREFGVEGKHFTNPSAPAKTELGFKEIANQYFFISGRQPVIPPAPETPRYVSELVAYNNAMVKYLEKDPWEGIKIEFPAAYKAASTPNEDKITDIVRGRRPLSDLDTLASDFRSKNGGDEARDLLAKALSNGGK
jgi:putative aldouronate transport system substrate-binding protein